VADYTKLKDDAQWRSFNLQLRATAASHDTLDVLDSSYVPQVGHENIFEQKQTFMYNVFSHCLLTTKGTFVYQTMEKTLTPSLSMPHYLILMMMNYKFV
jgi:hypothetical protein